MVARNEDFTANGYTPVSASAFSCVALARRVAAFLQEFDMSARRLQAEERLRLERKRQMQEDLRRQTIERLPLEGLIRLGFRHF
jgi:hypothetical protein